MRNRLRALAAPLALAVPLAALGQAYPAKTVRADRETNARLIKLTGIRLD